MPVGVWGEKLQDAFGILMKGMGIYLDKFRRLDNGINIHTHKNMQCVSLG